MFTKTGNAVTFCTTCACGPTFRTLPSNARLGNASTVMVTGSPGCTLPMSVSNTMAESWTVSRLAILRMTVPPPRVGLEITVPCTAFSWRIEPVIGARTCVSSIASLAVWRLASASVTAAAATDWLSLVASYSVSAMDCDRYRASLRLSWAVAVCSCARALSSLACASVRFWRGMRGSIRASSWPFLTSSPVWTRISMISPHAFDFTLNVRIGWITPEALAVTTMSRRSTGMAS
jgi:hypothetical protein